MAFPYLMSEGFENGTLGGFDSEADTDSKLSYPNYSRIPALIRARETAYKGAYSAFIDLSLGTADAALTEGDANAAASGTIAVRFYFYASNLTMAASDTFTIFSFDSAGATTEASVRVFNNAGTIEIQGGDGATFRAATLTQGVWHCVELVCTVDSGAGNDGVIQFFLNGGQVGANVTAVDQAAFTDCRLGAIGIDAGTTSGYLLFDEFALDDLRISPLPERFPALNDYTTFDQHVHVGRGRTRIQATAEDAFLDLRVYDTDNANTGVTAVPIVVLRNTAELEVVETEVEFHRGCFLDFVGGANPQAWVEFQDGGVFSKGQKLNFGATR